MASSVISSGSPSHGSWGGKAERSAVYRVYRLVSEEGRGRMAWRANSMQVPPGPLITRARCHFIHVEQQRLEDLGERDVPAQPQGEGTREAEPEHTRGMNTVEGAAA